ncbi:MAG: hypothetical protein Q9227_005633 [Pyrenula ochraceoflavens]
MSGGLNRSYLIYLPESYKTNTPAPLILSYHGRTKDAAEQELLSQFSNPTYNPDAIAVYPNGWPSSKGTRQWSGDPDAPSSINDITFTSDLITHLSSTYCIDPSRIYATGKSNGAGLCGLLACDPTTSSQIAAFAPVSGAFYLGVLDAPNSTSLPPCNPSPRAGGIPFLEFHGFIDKTIPYLGGEDSSDRGATVAIPQYMQQWAQRDGISDPSASDSVKTLCTDQGYPPVLMHSWGGGNGDGDGGGGVVQHYNISNLEHDWPSRSANDDDKSGTFTTCFEATEVIMEFFNRFTL